MSKDPSADSPPESNAVQLHLPDNRLAQALFGAHHTHLDLLGAKLDVHVTARGNHVTIKGERAKEAKAVLDVFHSRLVNGGHFDTPEFERVVSRLMLAQSESERRDVLAIASGLADFSIKTRKKNILPRTENQAAYIRYLRTKELVFGLGPAGTGKTFLAVARAVEMLLAGEVERLVLSRPAVEAGERLGFCPAI